MITKRRHIGILFLGLLLNGCISDGNSLSEQPRKQVYVDANLLFEISYPEEWVREPATLLPLAKETTTWRFNNGDQKEQLLKLSLLSLPAERNPAGYAGLENLLHTQNRDIIITAHENGKLPIGPVLMLTGETPGVTFELWLYLGKRRHYIISCSGATAHYERYRQLFSQIADSFMALE